MLSLINLYENAPTYFKRLCLQVAAMSGDARRALEICRRAAEFADYRVKQSRQSAQNTVSANKGTIHICVGVNYSRKTVCTGLFSLWSHSHINLDHQYKSSIRAIWFYDFNPPLFDLNSNLYIIH
jgi:hypothetical protein